MGKHGGGPSTPSRRLAEHSAGGSSNGSAALPSPDPQPFTQREFEQAQLTRLTGLGGHMPVFRATIGGRDYFVKSFGSAMDSKERPEHDLAARAVAKVVGLGDYTLPISMATRGGTTYEVQAFVHGSSLAELTRTGGLSRVNAFRLIPEDVRHLMELESYVIGERDRTTANFRADASTRHVYAIDFTRSFAHVTALYTEPSALERWGIGKGGAKDSFGSVAVPRATLSHITSARGPILDAVRSYGLSNTRVAAVKARLDILDRVLHLHEHPVYDDITAEAKAYGPQLWQHTYERP